MAVPLTLTQPIHTHVCINGATTMAMTQTEANKLTAAMNSAFEKIGNSNGTRMPKSDSNMDPIAYEFHVAAHLERIAKRRKEDAEKACVKEGVLFDTEKSPRKPGTT